MAGKALYASGSVLGTGAALEVVADKIGFRPKVVRITNLTQLATAVWYEGMADASAFLAVTVGTKSLITSAGITQRATGFSIGTNANLNTAGDIIHYECIGY